MVTQFQDISSKNIPLTYSLQRTFWRAFSYSSDNICDSKSFWSSTWRISGKSGNQLYILHILIPQNMIALNTSAKNFVDNKMP